MLADGRMGKTLLAVAAGLFAFGLVTGTIKSLSVERRLPAIDLLANGAMQYINVLMAEHRYDGAIEQLELQTRLLPHDAAAFEYLGIVLASQGHPEQARAAFQELLRLRPDYADGYNFLGSTYLDSGELESAAKAFVQALELKPDFPLALNNLGMTMAQSGKLELAEACFARAVELAPDFEQARQNLALARQQLGSRQ